MNKLKEILDILPKILGVLPQIVPFLKIIPVIMILAGVGYGAYVFFVNYRDPFKCFDNEIYERMSIDSNVYKFKGGYCVEGNQRKSN